MVQLKSTNAQTLQVVSLKFNYQPYSNVSRLA